MSMVLLAVGHILVAFLLACAVVLSLILTVQSVYTLYIMLYTWDQPEASKRAKAPSRFLPPRGSSRFTGTSHAAYAPAVAIPTLPRSSMGC